VVWKARQVKLNRLVALKMVLGDQRAGSKDLIRFLAEAEAVAAVKHPHVVQVYDYGEANGRPFLAMEYLPGGSLADRLERSGRLDPKAAAELVATLAAAVNAAHDLGIVHRDLKPGNVLYDEYGQPKVTDFGLAKRGGGSNLTVTQVVMGTPAYMAPEQARGDTKFVGPQADVYSLGVILFECLTGTRPFESADQIALLMRVVEDEPERPSKRAPGLPRDVELICLKCLAKDPAERYPTAGAMAADLGRFAADEPVSVRAAGVVERVAKWARRKPTLAAAYTLGLLAVLLGGLGGAAVWQWRAAEQARNEAETARGREATARAEAERQREKFERFEYGQTIQVAHREWHEDNVPAALALLERTRVDLRGWEWRYVHRLCHSELLTLRGHTNPVSSASFSPDGSRIVTGSWDRTAKVWDAQSGTEVLTLTGHTERVDSASFSPDGSRIVTGSVDETAKVWDATSGAELLTLKGHSHGVWSASFSRDGSRVLTASRDNTAKVWDARPFKPQDLAPRARAMR
jgi:tRNA A-37 threonylcarbamoyl transferase component Bud32